MEDTGYIYFRHPRTITIGGGSTLNDYNYYKIGQTEDYIARIGGDPEIEDYYYYKYPVKDEHKVERLVKKIFNQLYGHIQNRNIQNYTEIYQLNPDEKDYAEDIFEWIADQFDKLRFFHYWNEIYFILDQDLNGNFTGWHVTKPTRGNLETKKVQWWYEFQEWLFNHYDTGHDYYDNYGNYMYYDYYNYQFNFDPNNTNEFIECCLYIFKKYIDTVCDHTTDHTQPQDDYDDDIINYYRNQ